VQVARVLGHAGRASCEGDGCALGGRARPRRCAGLADGATRCALALGGACYALGPGDSVACSAARDDAPCSRHASSVARWRLSCMLGERAL
jgi:hypothetical protein